MLTAGGDRCVRFWSFENTIPSYTVCGVDKSCVEDVYKTEGTVCKCVEEKRDIATTVRNSEVRPVHPKAITDMVITGSEKEELLITSCMDGVIRIWKYHVYYKQRTKYTSSFPSPSALRRDTGEQRRSHQ